MAELDISILSPSKVITQQSASSITLPSTFGQIGILPGHAGMVSELSIGELSIEGQSSQKFFVSGGYVDIRDDKVVVLAEVVERPEDIDRARAEKALERAKMRIDKPTEDVNLARAMAAMARATQRLALAR